MSDEETFTRLLFYGVTLLGRAEREVWLMPLGALLVALGLFAMLLLIIVLRALLVSATAQRDELQAVI